MTAPIDRRPIVGVERHPITGITRIPIKEDETQSFQQELEWNDIYKALVNYIKFASKQVSSQFATNTLYSAEDYFQEGQLLLYHCFLLYKHKPMNEFSALFKASLWRKLRELGGKKGFIQVDLEDAYDIGYTEDVVETMFEEYKVQQVADMLKNSPMALTIFKEFVNPSNRTLWEAEMDMARKSMLKEQNYRIAVPKSVQIKSVHIQRALEISKVKFNEYFKLVKQCVSEVYGFQSEVMTEIADDPAEDDLQGCG